MGFCIVLFSEQKTEPREAHVDQAPWLANTEPSPHSVSFIDCTANMINTKKIYVLKLYLHLSGSFGYVLDLCISFCFLYAYFGDST